ncbi:MAG TPA: aldehyde dehydrogenase family protein [Planctomycetota bacterium]|nr:aldehyde dehydrogenase family protein [Planctomycetota bacterium]
MSTFLLDGQFVETPALLTITSPWPGVQCEPAPAVSPEQARVAARAAARVFPELRAMTRFKRSEALRKISDEISKNAARIALEICHEAGKPMALSHGEVQRAVKTFLWAAEEALRTPGDIVYPDRETQGAGMSGRVEYFPIGPILGITPFNFPINLVAHKVAPALAAGCPIVIKPPQQAPRAALMLAEIVFKSGLPPASLHVLPGGPELGKALCACPEFAAVSFTGSARAGWAIKQGALQRQKVLLELGGNAAAIVDQSADLDAAVAAIANAGYVYAGQVCIKTQRVFVHRAVADEFERKLAERILRGVGVSDKPSDENALVGPLIDKASADRVQAWVDAAIAAGANVLVRGERRGEKQITPWLLEAVPPDQSVACEEVFGPVVTFDVVKDFEEGIARANATKYGLQASVFTQSLRNAELAYRQLECGAVLVNVPTTFRLDSSVYGGVKDSGFGREGLAIVIREFSEAKLMVVKP